MPSAKEYQRLLQEKFGGSLVAGHHHQQDGQACALELESSYLGLPWTEDPACLEIFDVRPLNDMAVAADVRTPAMIGVLVAYHGSLRWSQERQWAVVTRLVVFTVQRLIAACSAKT